MADQQVDIVGALGKVVGAELEKANKKNQKIPDVYASGIRGSEKPPNLRNGDEEVQQARGKGMGKGIDPNKAQNAQRGKKVVQFEANKKSTRQQLKEANDTIAAMQKRLDALEKGSKKRVQIGG